MQPNFPTGMRGMEQSAPGCRSSPGQRQMPVAMVAPVPPGHPQQPAASPDVAPPATPQRTSERRLQICRGSRASRPPLQPQGCFGEGMISSRKALPPRCSHPAGKEPSRGGWGPDGLCACGMRSTAGQGCSEELEIGQLEVIHGAKENPLDLGLRLPMGIKRKTCPTRATPLPPAPLQPRRPRSSRRCSPLLQQIPAEK